MIIINMIIISSREKINWEITCLGTLVYPCNHGTLWFFFHHTRKHQIYYLYHYQLLQS